MKLMLKEGFFLSEYLSSILLSNWFLLFSKWYDRWLVILGVHDEVKELFHIDIQKRHLVNREIRFSIT